MTTPQAMRQEVAQAFIKQPLRSLALTALLLGGGGYAAKSCYDWYTTSPQYDAATCLKAVEGHIGKRLPTYIRGGATISPKAMFDKCMREGPRE